MRKSVLIFAIIAVALAGGTVYFVQQWLKAERAAMTAQNKDEPKQVVEKAEPKTYVLIAGRPLPIGSFVKPGDLRWQAWPDDQVPQQFVRKAPNTAMDSFPQTLLGSVVRRGIAAGQPLVEDFVVRKGARGFLAAVLQPGMRAVSINVDDATGISGLVFPGDRVDVILIHETVTKVGQEQVSNKVSETIIVNVRVLAIDQSTNDLDGKPTRARTVTLEVTPQQAEIIAVAARMGGLSLSLRSLAHTKDSESRDKAPAATSKTEPREATPGESGVPRAATHMTSDEPSAARKDGPEGDVASRCVAGSEACEQAKPTRGKTYTIDREFSRFLSRSKKDENINVIRGNKSESVDPNQGSVSGPDAQNGATKTPARRSTTNTAGEQ